MLVYVSVVCKSISNSLVKAAMAEITDGKSLTARKYVRTVLPDDKLLKNGSPFACWSVYFSNFTK